MRRAHIESQGDADTDPVKALHLLPRSGSRADRGTAAVEAVFAVPLLILLVIGFIELSGALRSRSATSHLASAGGRMASVAGADPMADQLILARMANETAGLGSAQIDYIVVWHAQGPGESVPEACRPTSTAEPNQTSLGVGDGGIDAVGACNVYVRPHAQGGAFEMASGATAEEPSHYFGCQGPADPEADHKLDCSWPGKNRRVLTSPRDFLGTAAPTDFVGVHVEVRHDMHTPMLPDLAYADATLNLIEPQGYEL